MNPWNRSDGAALALALLKDLGDAMMKKMDITNPKRPGAQQTQQARIEVYGSPGSASASLPSRVELVRSVGGVQAEIPMEQALHLIASALVPETAAKETAFSRCLRLAAAVKEDLLICAGVLEDSGFPRWEGLIAAATFAARSITRHRAELTAALLVLKQWGWLERVKCALQHQESIERNEFTRAEIAKSIQDLCEATSWTDIRKRGARRTPESLRLGSWHLVASTRPRLVQRTPLTTVKYDEDRSQVANGDNDDELPLVQMGALPGETIYCGARTLVLEKGTVAASASACEEQGLVVASTAAETSSRPERFLGQTCDCSGRSCACPAAIIRERGAQGTWRDQVLPQVAECCWKQPSSEAPHDGSVYAALLASVPPRLRGDPVQLARAICQALSEPRDVLTETERKCWWQAVRAMEAELLGVNAANLKRKCRLAPRHVLEYWRQEQPYLMATAVPDSAGHVPLPPELAGLTHEARCPCPGCPGSLLEAERFVRSVDEESQTVLRCCHPTCGYVARKR